MTFSVRFFCQKNVRFFTAIMSANSIRKHILVPLTITLLVLLATFLFSIYKIKHKEVTAVLDQQYEAVLILSREIRDERAEVMKMALELLARDDRLQRAMAAEKRTELLALTASLHEKILRPAGISHFYFHRPDGRVFLRVHKPEFFGDQIERFTLAQALQSRETVDGVELGPLGTFTHRMVMPWYGGGELIGFIEVGEDIDLFLKRVRQSTGIEYAVLVDKAYLAREGWLRGMAMLDRPADWDRLAGHVLVDQSVPELPEGFVQALALDHENHADRHYALTVGERELRGRSAHLIDARGQAVGDILVMLDVTDRLATFNRSMAVGAGLTVFLGGLLFLFAYVMLGRTSRQLADAQYRLITEFERAKQANDQLEWEMAERQKAQDALKEANERLEQRVIERTVALQAARDDLRRLIDNAHSLIMTTDARGCIEKWNRTAEQITGIPREAARGRVLIETVLEPPYRERGRRMFAQVLAGDSITNFEFPLRSKRGEKISLLLNATGRRDAQGKITGTIVVCQDITSRKRAEEATRSALRDARQASERIDVILRSVADGLLVVNEMGEVLLMNDVACKLFQLDPTTVVGRSVATLLPDPALVAPIRRALEPFSPATFFDFDVTDSAGGRRIVHARTSPIREQLEGRDGLLILMQDVTQQRMVDRMKSEFISTVAHEFRTPLATVLGFSELLLSRDDFSPEQRREFLTYIFEKADSLSDIVDDLLDLSRIESGREIELRQEPVAAEEAFMPVVRDFRLQYPDHIFEAEWEAPSAPLHLDRRKISQVMENLLSNAVKYSPDRQRVKIIGRCHDEGYLVQVSDSGIGMSPEQKARVFEKFYRADSSNIAVAGTGLGMSIVKHFVEAHGGRVWLESQPGVGTTVSFILPLAAVCAAQDLSSSSSTS